MTRPFIVFVLLVWSASGAVAQDGSAGRVFGRVTDETGGVLPGVMIELTAESGASSTATASATGEYAFDHIVPGRITCRFR